MIKKPKIILLHITQNYTATYHPKLYCYISPKIILLHITQNYIATYHPKLYCYISPKIILLHITQNYTATYHPKLYCYISPKIILLHITIHSHVILRTKIKHYKYEGNTSSQGIFTGFIMDLNNESTVCW